jgi:NitT/TauT family transport system substrate-binding protein
MRLVRVGGRITGHRRARRPVRVLAFVTAAVAGLAFVVGCRVPGMSSSAAGPAGTATVTVAATPGVPDAPLYIAYQDGFFRDAGINLHIVNYSSVRAEVRDLQARKVDVAFGDYADMFYKQAQALAARGHHKSYLNMVLVADGYDAAPNVMEVLTLPTSGIVSPKDLQGKTIGTPPADLMPTTTSGRPYSLDTVATQSVLNNDNVNPSAINWQPLPSQALIGDLASGQVDAILATEPTIFEAEQQLGAVPVLDSCSGSTANLPLDGYFALRSFANQKPAVLTAFRSALERGQAAASQEAPVRATLQGYAGLSVESASLVTLGQYPTSMNASDLQRIVGLMFFFGAINSVQGSQLPVKNMIFR